MSVPSGPFQVIEAKMISQSLLLLNIITTHCCLLQSHLHQTFDLIQAVVWPLAKSIVTSMRLGP